MPKTVCFDLETELFVKAFRDAKGSATRQRLAPKMRVGCTFDGTIWKAFLAEQADDLLATLLAANVVISFNGLAFDELVLRRHHGLDGPFPRKGRHLDLFAELDREGRGASLDRLSRANLGEGKLVSGRSMASLDIESLTRACRSDVWQTWRLWKLWEAGKLLDAAPRTPRRIEADDPHDVGPGHHAPDICPHCGDVSSLELVELDTDEDEMSEGQASDYEAGMWGVSICQTCHEETLWGI